MTNPLPKKVLLVTSFHRSGSSMVGKILSNAGLFMGDSLLQAHRSNPDGHFEDAHIMQAHEKALTKCGTSWQFDDSHTLDFDRDDHQYLMDLIANRNRTYDLWGFKDPRSCLFLDNWSQLLAQSGHYLFLYRHYSECIASLYRRHSQFLCLDWAGDHSSPHIAKDLNFWIDENLAAKMWLAYNRRLLAFFIKNRDKSLLVSQQAILSGYPLIQEINTKFNFDLQITPENSIQKNYTHTKINSVELGAISPELYKEMDSLWESLNTIADAPCLTSKIDSKNESVNLSEKIDLLIEYFNPVDKTSVVKNEIKHNQTPLTVEEKIKLHLKNNDCQSALKLLPDLLNSAPLKAEYWILAGTIYMRDNNYDQAQQSYCYAIALNPIVPYFYMHLGQAFLAQDKKTEAKHFFQLAAEKNPKNPSFFLALGNFYDTYQQFDQADISFKHALELEKHNVQFLNRYCRFLIERGETEQAKALLKSHCENNPPSVIIKQYASLLLGLGDYQTAMSWYKKWDLLTVKNADLNAWLSGILAKIPTTEMRENFKYWLCYHWDNIKSL